MKKISQNLIWMSAANVVSSIFNALVFIYLAKKLQPEAFGQFSFVQTLVFFLFNFIDLGLSTYGVREVSKHREGISEYVSNIVSLRFIVAAALYVISFVILIAGAQSLQFKVLMLLMLLLLFSSALSTEWAFQGIEKMHMVFISFSTTLILQLVLLLTFVRSPRDLLAAPLVIFIAAQPIIILFLRILKFKLKIRLDFKSLKNYFSSALIIWAISLFAQVYNGLDIVILGFFRPAVDVGNFSVARRFITGIIFFSMFLANAFLPRMSATFKNELKDFQGLTRNFIKLMLLLGTLLFVVFLFFSEALITLIIGKGYLPASFSLKILVFGAVWVLFNMPFSTGLIAAGYEKDVLKQAVASAILSVALNFALIPKLGAEGASISFFYAEALGFILILWFHYKRFKFSTIAQTKT